MRGIPLLGARLHSTQPRVLTQARTHARPFHALAHLLTDWACAAAVTTTAPSPGMSGMDGDMPEDVERCRQIIAQQREDMQHLKELVVRHESIIAEYQTAYPELNPHTKVDGSDGPAPPLPPWMASTKTMVPLLAAYDRRVQLLETSIEFHKQEVEGLKANSLELVEENETLRSDLKHYMEAALNSGGGGGGSGGGGGGGGGRPGGGIAAGGALGDELEALQEQNHVLAETNAVLTQQTAVLEADVEQSHADMERLQAKNFELEKRAAYLEQSMKELDRGRLGQIDATRTSFTRKVESLSEGARREIQLLQKEIGEISAEKRVLETTLQQRVAQITDVEAKYAAAEKERGDLEQRLHQVTARHEEMSKTYTSLKSTVATQSYGDVKRIKQLEIDFEDAKTEVAESRRAANVASSRNAALEKELDELRQQQASMVECMNAYDRQLGQLTDREDSIQALSNAAKETVQDAILQRDKAQQEVTALRAELAHVHASMEEMRSESISSAVTAQTKAEASARATIDGYRDEMDGLRHKNTQLEQVHERLQREKQSATSELDRITAALNEERANFLKSTDDLASKCLGVEQTHSDAVRATEQLKHELAAEKDRAHKMRQNFTRDLETLHQKSEASDRKCVALAESVRRLKHELLASKTEGSRLVTELQNTQDELNERFSRLRLEYSEFQANAEKQVQELQMETERAKRFAQHVAQERAEQGEAMAQEMEAVTNKLRAAFDSKNAKCIELEKLVRRMRAEVGELQRAKKEDRQLAQSLQEELAQQESALKMAEGTVTQRQQQLAAMLQREEERLAAEKKLRVEKQQLQLRSRQLEKEVESMERQLGSVQNHAYTLAQPPRTQLSPGEAASFSRTVRKLKKHNAHMRQHPQASGPPMSVASTDDSEDDVFATNF